MFKNRLHKKGFSIHKDAAAKSYKSDNDLRSAAAAADKKSPELHGPIETPLAPASTGVINSMKSRSPAPSPFKQGVARSGTIRSVASFDGSESSPDSRHSALSSSLHSNTSALSSSDATQRHKSPSASRFQSEPIAETPSRWSAGAARVVEPLPDPDASTISDGAEPLDGQWDSTIGKAGLGKTGRVINKLVSDNEALKRDIRIERLRSEEAKQAAKLVEDKMERMMSDYESRLLEANVTKTLLARKERQVETLTAIVETEKQNTVEARKSEKIWKEEMEKMRADTTTQVDEATSYAQLMEGRYNAISSHWHEQGDEVKRAVSKLRGEIDHLVEERRKDDDKIQTLRDLCDQQDSNIRQLKQEKEDIALKFDEYKKAQEEGLKGIKTNAKWGEEEQARLLEESRTALNKLKWALNVKENVKDAQ